MNSYQVSERPDSCLEGRHLRSDRTEEDGMSLKNSEELRVPRVHHLAPGTRRVLPLALTMLSLGGAEGGETREGWGGVAGGFCTIERGAAMAGKTCAT